MPVADTLTTADSHLIEQADSVHAEQQSSVTVTYVRRDTIVQYVFHTDTTSYTYSPAAYIDTSLYVTDIDTSLYVTDTDTATAGVMSYKDLLSGNDSIFNTEISGRQHGTAGSLPPFNAGSDNVITALLLAAILLTLVCLSRSLPLIVRETKTFFRTQHGDRTFVSETTNEIGAQMILALQNCLMLSVLSFIYLRYNTDIVFFFNSQYTLLWILLAGLIAYYIVKALLYSIVNLTFFDKRTNRQWLMAYLYMTAMQGLVLLPVVLLQIYFDITIETALICTIVTVILVKILSFYKCFAIFFKHGGGLLQLILYFCALEITPPLFLWGVLVMTTDCFKLNF